MYLHVFFYKRQKKMTCGQKRIQLSVSCIIKNFSCVFHTGSRPAPGCLSSVSSNVVNADMKEKSGPSGAISVSQKLKTKRPTVVFNHVAQSVNDSFTRHLHFLLRLLFDLHTMNTRVYHLVLVLTSNSCCIPPAEGVGIFYCQAVNAKEATN